MNEDSFDEFYRANWQRLMHYAFAMCGDFGVAQDLTQEAFVRAWLRWSRLSEFDQPEMWLRLIVGRLVTDRWRWLAVRSRAAARARPPDPGPPPEDGVVLAEALRLLPFAQRRALVLHYLYGMTIAEIAHETSANAGTVKSWLSRGRSALHRKLNLPEPGVRETNGVR